jgi:hypothetical protein
LLFQSPLTEKQVHEQHFDFQLSFLDSFVQTEVASGKPEYDPAKREAINSNDFNPEGELNFAPY